MKSMKSKLFATALAAAFLAAPITAFGQNMSTEAAETMKARQLEELAEKNKRMNMHEGSNMPHSANKNYRANTAGMSEKERVDQLLQSNETMEPTTGDDQLLMSSGDLVNDDRMRMRESDNEIENNMIVVPTVDSNILTTVACPVGTTAQTNGTCLITGNYNY